jgi:hypothetical protein
VNTLQGLYLAASLIAGVALAAALRRDPKGPGRTRIQLALSLTGVSVALLCVGVVSRTFVRHVVQIIPPVLVLILVARRSPFATAAAAPVLTFWLGIMANIWMFVLGIARIFTGTFTPTEIALTIVIALSAVVGLAAILREGTRVAIGRRLALAAALALLQFAALVMSFMPIFR